MQTEPVVTRYEANATQLLAELEKIRAGQAQVSDVVGKQVAALSTQNAALQKSVKFWGGLNVAITAIPGIVNKVTETFDEMAGVLQQREAAAGVAVGQLDTALKGQLRTTELYTLAANLNHGALKLTQTQMNQVAGAIRKLSLDGENATEVADAFGKALDMNDAGPLKKFGLGLKDVDGKARSLADVLRTDVVEAANESANTMETQSERMREASNRIKNGIDDAKAAIASFGAEVMEIQSGRKGQSLDTFGGWMVALSGGSGGAGVAARVNEAAAAVQAFANKMQAARDRFSGVLDARSQDFKNANGLGDTVLQTGNLSMTGTYADSKKRGGGKGFDLVAYNRFLDALALKQAEVAAEAARLAPRGFDGVDGLGGFDAGGTLARERERNADARKQMADAAAKEADDREREAREKVDGMYAAFGVGKMDAQAVGLQMLGEVMQVTGQAAAGMYEAIVTGSEPAGQALKRIAAQGILAAGASMQVKAIEFGAAAVGFLVTGDAVNAALAAKTAAMYQAGAVIAGGVARGLGAGGGSSGSGGGARSAQPVNGNPALGDGAGRNNTTIVYGDSFANDSPRARQRTAAQLVDLARRETSSSARFN